MSTALKVCTNASKLICTSLLLAFAGSAAATPLAVPDLPLFLPESVPPLNMMVLGRDHKLYYEAYNDASDLDGDQLLDVGYKGYMLKSPAPAAGAAESPYKIDYYGYFDSFKCYTYNSGVFEPQSFTANKQCSGQWSGDYLNYLTTARIDGLRKVLYGGYRSTDTATETILERSHVPQDSHSWGKEYGGLADGYDIRNYTPIPALPSLGRYHLFANTTPLTANGYNEPPRLRFLTDRTNRIWNWVSKERPVAGTSIDGGGGVTLTLHTNDLYVRVKVCVSDRLEANCIRYPDGNYKPTGLLQEFGENDAMSFGLLSGSYQKNTSGGVLRRAMGSIRDEINTTTNGTFRSYNGIIRTLNRLRVTGFGTYSGDNYRYACGWITGRAINEGECQIWGNPVAEMMYESLRYFAGSGAATSTFSITAGAGEEANLPGGGLPVATWDNPYSGRPVCSKPFQTVISDINPSYDGGLPGNAFSESAPTDLLGDLDVAALGQTMWNQEFGGPREIFIGQSGADANGAPTPKTVTSFGDIRGLAPEEPTKKGTYYSGSVAYHGRKLDLSTLNSDAGEQHVSTFSVALASPLPQIAIPVGGRTITLVPFAKSVYGDGAYAINPAGSFQPTNQIVDFYVQSMAADGTSGTFRVNFEDVEQGADHDMDAIAIYSYQVNAADNTVTVTVTSEYAAGGIVQHMGYIISGSTADGTYLVVRDVDTGAATDVDYFLDTPPAFSGTPPAPSTGTGTWDDNVELPTTATARTFFPGDTAAATLLKDPLWYAAKWGGFDESFRAATDRNDIPDAAQEWDANGDGQPDNYFLVTNALKLSAQLRKAFQDILRRTTASSSASVNSGSISSETRIYQARFNTGEWTGELISYELDPATGDVITDVDGNPDWEASDEIPAHGSRDIITVNTDGTPVAFRWDELDTTRRNLLDADTTRSQNLVDYLRGDASNEGQRATEFRERPRKLGDIVSSSPLFIGRPPFRYSDSLESVPYSDFATDQAARPGMVYAGANDGMLHGFDAETGEEVFGFIPSAVFPNLKELASQSYSHRFFVDGPPSMGDVFYSGDWHTVLVGGLNKGGQEIYALDVTNPTTSLSSAEANPESIVLWEFTDADDPDLGLTYSQPAIVKLRNGKWAAVFGNGYNSMAADGAASTTGNAVLFIVDIETGAVIRELDTGTGIAQAPSGVTWDNGLATPALVDLNGDRIVEYAYAGDLYGNMWKFDLSSTNSTDWKVAYEAAGTPLPLYQARDASTPTPHAQPITVRPEVGRGPGGAGMIVLFGTGKYLEASDKMLTPVRPQTFYGIVDRNTGANTDIVAGRANLTQQQIIAEQSVDPDGAGPLEAINVRASTNNLLGSNSGWYIDLLSPVNVYKGERQVSNPIVRNGNVIFTTLIPDSDPCEIGGSWIMELKVLDGSRLDSTPFDLNNDGQFTDADRVTVTLADGTTVNVPISGLGSEEGILQSPGVIESETGPPGAGGGGASCVQYKYLPGSSGNIQRVTENCGPGGTGRQSWRQIR